MTAVLVTGGAGLIGRVLRAGLADSYDVRILDLAAEPGESAVRADMTDPAAVASAFQGVDAVVDLAARADAETSWEEVLANNVTATRNAFEAARLAGVRKFVYASSNFITGGYDVDEPYRSVLAGDYDGLRPGSFPLVTTSAPLRPDSPYAVGKAFGEATGRYYAERHGMSVYALRIGTVNAENRPLKPRHFAKWLSHRDLVQLVGKCLAAPVASSGGFSVYYGVSRNSWRIWDIGAAAREIGYEPVDDAETFRSDGNG